jgi:bifunctional non-homologous end joining protein LigD
LPENLRIRHPKKILYPEAKINKLDLVEYYNDIQDWIMPYIKNRILTIVRCPDGYTKECFYQKHVTNTTSKAIRSMLVKEKEDTKPEPCIYIDDVAGLLALVQMGTLEIHLWGSAIKNIEKPDMLVFDLDPAPDVKWSRVVAAAF